MTSVPSGGTILVVDDNPTNIALVTALLEAGGYKVMEATSAEQALDFVQEVKPALILMDVRLPGEDGLTATKRLRANPATASIPVIALTAHAMKGDQDAALAAGCDGYISKPIDTRTFELQIRTIVERSGKLDAG